MKIMFVKLMGCLLVPFVIASCSKAPKCSDSDVVKQATEIAQEIWFNQISGPGSIGYNTIVYGLQVEDPAYRNILTKASTRTLSLADLKESKSEKIIAFLKETEPKIKAMKLKSITTQSIDKELKKCSCEADFINDKNQIVPIKFRAQKTDEDKIKVEISFN